MRPVSSRVSASAIGLLALLTLGPAAAPGEAEGPGTKAERGIEGCFAASDAGVLTDLHGDRLMTPASVLKVLVSAAAMHHLGPDYRAVTRVVAEGELRSGVLIGNLVWVGGGDPTWNQRFHAQDPRKPIHDLIRQLKKKGLTRVQGDLVIDASHFPGRPFPAVRAINEVAFGFAAPTAALAVDEGALEVYIAPGKTVGAPAIARPQHSDKVPDSLVWTNRMTTAAAERDGRGTVDFQPVWHSMTLNLRGEYPITEPPYRLSLAVPDGELYAGEVILAELKAAGIRVEGGVTVRRHVAPPGRSTTPLASWSSPPLLQWLPPILQESSNWYAEMLVRQIALATTGEGRADSGLDQIAAFLTETVGVDEGAFQLDDGSGISPYNLIAPRAVVQVLRWSRRQGWSKVWIDSFAGSKEGTLEAWPALPRGMVAKTGTLRHVLALAGYAGLGSPAVVEFACFLGHRTDPRPALRRELVASVRAAVALP